MTRSIRTFFSNVSPFDAGVLAVGFLCLVGFFLFFYRKSEYVSIRVKVTDQDVLYANTLPKDWYAGMFEVGDTERDVLGNVITKITGMEIFPSGENKKAVYLDLQVKATYDTRTKIYTSHGNPLIFGTPIRINLSHVTFDGFVTEFPGWEKQQNYHVGSATVTVLARSLEPAVADAIKEGDSILDNHNVTLAKVVTVLSKPADTVVNTAAGQLLLQPNPLYKDLVLTLKMRTETYNGEPYVFDNLPLKIGATIPLNFPNINLNSISPLLQQKNTDTYPIITNFSLDN